MAAPPSHLKRRLTLERTDSTGSLPSHLADLSFNSTHPTPAASPGPSSGTGTPLEAGPSTAGPSSQQGPLGRGKRSKTRHSTTPGFVLALPAPAAPKDDAQPASKVKCKDKGKGKAKAQDEAQAGKHEWWFTKPDERERRSNAFMCVPARSQTRAEAY